MAPNRFTNTVDAISEWLGIFAELLIIATVAIGFYNVVARYIGRFIGQQLSSNVFIELQWYLFSIVFFLGFAYILKNGINVRVDFLYTNFSVKRKALVDIIGHTLFLIPFCIIGIWVSYSPVLRSWGRLPNGTWGTWEISPDPGGLPRAPLKTMIIVAFVLLLLQTISEVMKLWAVYRGQAKPEIAGLDADAPIRIE